MVAIIWPLRMRKDIRDEMVGGIYSERCGLVLRRGTPDAPLEHADVFFQPSLNVASMPWRDYRISSTVVGRHLENIVAIIHSHPKGDPQPSRGDIDASHADFLYGIWARERLHLYEVAQAYSEDEPPIPLPKVWRSVPLFWSE